MTELVSVGDEFVTKSKLNAHAGEVIKIIKVENPERRDGWGYWRTEKRVGGRKNHRARIWWFLDECDPYISMSMISTLLYLETCLVDGYGRVAAARMNIQDIENIAKFVKLKWIEFGRLYFKAIEKLRELGWSGGAYPTNWVRFTDKAWEMAHIYRRQRSERMIGKENAKLLAEMIKNK